MFTKKEMNSSTASIRLPCILITDSNPSTSNISQTFIPVEINKKYSGLEQHGKF